MQDQKHNINKKGTWSQGIVAWYLLSSPKCRLKDMCSKSQSESMNGSMV
jgi:hypothetical protein